ncbi:transcription-repair coupling factor [Ruminococcus sp.]|uniref:transcription-repair coupling factor n=1 Tax=Ruminococcus sp. TaxID=41978 RepID=UPI0025F74E9B|nr:transcription-repair coupling factor [Ruminococcus sp.]
MQFFAAAFEKLAAYRGLLQARKDGASPVSFTGVSQIHKAHLLAALCGEQAPILAVTAEEAEARRLCDDINAMLDEPAAWMFPAKELVLTPVEGITTAYEHARIAALTALQQGQCRVVAASVEALLQPTLSPEILEQHTILLHRDDTADLGELIRRLTDCGYVRCEGVSGAGQFAVRGDILDVFPVQMQAPVRMEFWDDTIDTLVQFDPDTQRRTDPVEELLIPPARETLCEPTELAEKIRRHAKSLCGKYAEIAREKLYADADNLDAGMIPVHLDKYAPLLRETPSMVFDYGVEMVTFSEYGAIVDTQRSLMAQYQEDCKLLLEEGNLCRRLEGYYQNPAEVAARMDGMFQIYLSNFLQGGEHVTFQKLLSVEALQNAPWGGELRQLTEDLLEYSQQGYCTMLYAGSEKTLPILQQDLRESGIQCELAKSDSVWKAGTVYLRTGSLSGGFAYPEVKTALITQARTMRAVPNRKKKHRGEEIRTLADITPGDLVVHALHGIGRFLGIRKLELEGVIKDYITIQYAGKENLYVPVTQLDMVSKYIGPREDAGVKLSRLSSPEWQKTRNNVRRAVKDMADELLALYAKREKTKGFAFYPDDEMQHDFETRFPYVETEDQLACIEEVKQDMERERPMDRLLCGDVGFGKTEVALRAAMKCVLSGKQCAILVPTTVLAMQHYQTAVRRFEHFPVNVVMLSRFVPQKRQKEILKELKSGKADIVIGTHRIVQKDVEFHALGLAIVDEEQRFGVAHKEKFKEMFTGVDMLTLSATPIPRTLNMAMSGIRDMSVISQPPQDRYPVQTYVMEYSEPTLIQAIQRELKRGGQVYYIHNRVDTIEFTASKLQKYLPDARILVAHGRMGEAEMSEIWRKLVEHEADILVCTTIIETGVDVPNVNTLIIENADCFGLSQLYQLRGRVGRSNRRAYAYFTFKRDKVLREESARRLAAMREFTQFGSGFHIALRDLEIRGAGSLLGGRQHGHMESVGYDMYLRLLGEAVAEAKGEPIQETAECTVDIQIDAHIPEKYMESLSQRLDMYRKIASVHTAEDEMDLLDELIDRYGEPPKEVMGLITVSRLRNTAAQLGITEITQRSGSMLFYLEHPTPEMITALSAKYRGRVQFGSVGKSYLGVKLEQDKPLELMREILQILHETAVKGK